MNTTKQITIDLSDELVSAINAALETRENKNFNQVAVQALTLGIKQLNYRTKRNAEQYAAFKEFRASQK